MVGGRFLHRRLWIGCGRACGIRCCLCTARAEWLTVRDVEPLSDVRFVIVCEECGAVAEGHARRWRAYLFDVDDDGHDELVCYCPSCAAFEFGSPY